jgi:release factor glutamine methyltransferase
MANLSVPATLAQALIWAQVQGLERLDAQLLLLHALGRAAHDRAWLLAHDTDAITDFARSVLQSHTQRRLKGEPVAYLTGHKEFYGLDLMVDARVLVPRPDTETLVDWALEILEPLPQAKVVDLGTGSGAIALALKATQPSLQVMAVDASTDALNVASANAQRLGLDVDFVQTSWLNGVTGPFDAIVSNPPYIADQDNHLAALTHEPYSALASGSDGLDDIRSIVSQATTRLKQGGWLLLEHGYDQSPEVCALLRAAGFADVQCRLDLAGIARCSGGQWPA